MEPLEGFVCLKCGGTEAYPSPSGMVVLCPSCPWTEMVPQYPKVTIEEVPE